MKSSGKIIIKPRSSKRSAARQADSESSIEEENESNPNDQMDEKEPVDTATQPLDSDEADDPQEQGDGEETEEVEQEEVAPAPVKRPRGRPKGSSTKSSGLGGATPSSTPRGRPARARGRPRGRPPRTSGAAGGLTIRLKAPKGEDDSSSEEEYTPEAEAPTPASAAAAAPTPPPQAAASGPKESRETPAKEGPMGGGKPFRKIQDKVYVIDGDEFITEDNPKGDEKIDKWGNLLGGRKFKSSTFILPNRHPQRQYMLAIDAARTSGFRDSLYYFRRNLLAFKLNATQPEKDYLISEGKLGPGLRTRNVTLITARSAFKLHGSKMVIDGRWVTDDYDEVKVLAEITLKGLSAGDPVGELPDPNAPAHPQPEGSGTAGGASSNFLSSSNANVAGGGGGGIYRAGGPTTIFGGSGWGPFSDGPLNAVRKSLLSRDGVTEENWMWMMAGRVGEADDEWSRLRKEGRRGREGRSVDGVVMGGKGSNWTRVDPPPPRKTTTTTGVVNEDGNVDIKTAKGQETDKGKTVNRKKRKNMDSDANLEGGGGAIGVYEPHSNLILYRADSQPTRARWESIPSPKRRILGGTKAGNGAWGLAWVDTVMQLPEEDDEAKRKRQEEQRERELFIKEAEEMFGQGRGVSVVPSAIATTGAGRGGSVMPRGGSVMSIGV